MTDFDEIWTADAFWPLKKNQNLKIEDGRRPSFWKWKSSFTLVKFPENEKYWHW